MDSMQSPDNHEKLDSMQHPDSDRCLYDIEPGQQGIVKEIHSPGAMRRRLMDLGLIPGTEVTCLSRSPFGDPAAFLIRGAMIALRKKDCRDILLEEIKDEGAMADDIKPRERLVALAGNPNVGKSTIFNALTGMNQHTGNWPGKTVALSKGRCSTEHYSCLLTDIPGTYSLMAHSAEEEIARDFLCFGRPDAIIVVCDATCLERNMNLVLQTLEISSQVIVCVNLIDEARRKQIKIDLPALSHRLGVPVVGTNARKKETLEALLSTLDDLLAGKDSGAGCHPYRVHYPKAIEQAISMLEPLLAEKQHNYISSHHLLNERWLSLRLLESDPVFLLQVSKYCGWQPLEDPEIGQSLRMTLRYLEHEGISMEEASPNKRISSSGDWDDSITASLISQSEKICKGTISYKKKGYHDTDRRLDRVFTGRFSAFPVMLLMLSGLFWLTIVGANVPSALLARGLFSVQEMLSSLFFTLKAPTWLHGILVLGLFRVLAWVISVMLPPMAIFFPLFTLLEDSGLLPRMAYNLDKPFQCCHACGKQCLSMAMGIGCNAAGVTGCRIIDSPRERTLAILTNSLVPCNGRFPALISIITMFFAGSAAGWYSPALCSLMLTGLILLGVCMTFLVTGLLSSTLLRGLPSAFTLELPSYRMPQIRKVLIRSVLDRTLFVLGRAALVAAPAGAFLWVMANVTIGGDSLLHMAASLLDPMGRLMGLDGVILVAFILGFPANEIVLPIMVMAYLSEGTLSSTISLSQMHQIFLANGWTAATAICTLVFMLMHWPCSTTLLTIKKETGSWGRTALAAVIPASCGFVLCVFLNLLMKFVRIL